MSARRRKSEVECGPLLERPKKRPQRGGRAEAIYWGCPRAGDPCHDKTPGQHSFQTKLENSQISTAQRSRLRRQAGLRSAKARDPAFSTGVRCWRRAEACQLSLRSLNSGSARFVEVQSPAVRGMAQQASLFQRLNSLRPGRHPARLLQGVHRPSNLTMAAGRRLRLLFRHRVRPYVGGFNSPASQPRISDCIGSCDTLTA
jgi:hypothetical protein